MLIPLSIGLYFRRLRAVLFVMVPAVLATILAYAVAYLVFGYLTTVTSFLVSFIMGNGTNYAIVLLARYEERAPDGPGGATAATLRRDRRALAQHRRRRHRLGAQLPVAAGHQLPRLLAVRPDRRRRLPAGLVTTFTVMPALLRCSTEGRPPPRRRRRRPACCCGLGRLIERSPGAVLWSARLSPW